MDGKNLFTALCPALIIFVFLLLATPARSNVVGTDMQNFNPTTGGIDFVTVHSSETLEPGIINLGFFLNYAVNVLPYYEDQDAQNRVTFNDTLLVADFNVGAGLLKNWEVGLSIPHLIRQKIDNDTYHLQFSGTGIMEIRIGTKYRFWYIKNHGLAFIFSASINRIENNPFTGQEPGPTYNFELAYDTTWRKWALGANIGYRKRNSGDPVPSAVTSSVIIEPSENQYIASLAASYHLEKYDSKIIAEIFSSFPAKKVQNQSNRSQSSAEFLLGVKHDFNRYIALHAGGGTMLIRGNASPDWRVYTGINWAFGPVFSDSRQVYRIMEGEHTRKLDPSEKHSGPEESFIIKGILFNFNSDRLRTSAREPLEELVRYIKKAKRFRKLIVEGHTDSVGSATYNLDLSRRRAGNVKLYLVKKYKIRPSKIKAKGYGESRPIGDNGNFQGRQLNRRVQFRVIW